MHLVLVQQSTFYLKQENNGIAKNEHVIVCLSGRGDKDVNTVAEAIGVDI